ncbi:MAG: PAS domain-containing protein [Campylobacterales bacterium]|nr:PAS domain-containing protein [Campylobacterales bacterium]
MKKTTILNEEYKFKDGLIVSSTDLKGVVTYANRKFCEISGYSKEELVGSNHNIIRHPDMPRSAFEDLWGTINQGYTWEGIVKNLRKDGKYYWVHTFITPIKNENKTIGYSAARRSVSKSELETAQSLYTNLLKKEEREVNGR